MRGDRVDKLGLQSFELCFKAIDAHPLFVHRYSDDPGPGVPQDLKRGRQGWIIREDRIARLDQRLGQQAEPLSETLDHQ